MRVSKVGMIAASIALLAAPGAGARADGWYGNGYGPTPQQQEWRTHQQWREHEWREHEWREHEWREHEWREREWRERNAYRPYTYNPYAYNPPVVTYRPPAVTYRSPGW